MLGTLNSIIQTELPALLKDPSKWDSLIINRRKPHTYRIFTQLGEYRVCLHRFDECHADEAFLHPHPWPGAFKVIQGSYSMRLGYSKDRFSKPDMAAEFIMGAGSSYEITNPLTWHSVIPQELTYTVMINGTPWDADTAHTEVRTTKGKDLEKMEDFMLKAHLHFFGKALERHNK